MTDNTLEFLKKYHHRGNLVKYKFENVNGVWIGVWSINSENRENGKSHCLTYLVQDDAWDISCGAPVMPGEPLFPRIRLYG